MSKYVELHQCERPGCGKMTRMVRWCSIECRKLSGKPSTLCSVCGNATTIKTGICRDCQTAIDKEERTRRCVYCGNLFVPQTETQTTCSRSCKDKNMKEARTEERERKFFREEAKEKARVFLSYVAKKRGKHDLVIYVENERKFAAWEPSEMPKNGFMERIL